MVTRAGRRIKKLWQKGKIFGPPLAAHHRKQLAKFKPVKPARNQPEGDDP